MNPATEAERALAAEAERLARIAEEAGRIAAAFFRLDARTSAEVFYKAGNSPVTEADIAADTYLRGACADAFPDCAWLSEETADTGERRAAKRVVIVDPIDGTKAFLSGDPRWCVSVALVEDGRPVAAALSAPALGELFMASAGSGATLNGERLRIGGIAPEAGRAERAAYGPRPMIDWLARLSGEPLRQLPRIPSLAYRIALVAKGSAALGLAGADSHDWDIAGADLILTEAGGALLDIDGERPVYNRADPVHPPLIAGEAGLARRYATLAGEARRGG